MNFTVGVNLGFLVLAQVVLGQLLSQQHSSLECELACTVVGLQQLAGDGLHWPVVLAELTELEHTNNIFFAIGKEEKKWRKLISKCRL